MREREKAYYMPYISVMINYVISSKHKLRECSGSVVECFTPDRGVAGSSLTSVTALCH